MSNRVRISNIASINIFDEVASSFIANNTMFVAGKLINQLTRKESNHCWNIYISKRITIIYYINYNENISNIKVEINL